jgi:hypothetical protein
MTGKKGEGRLNPLPRRGEETVKNKLIETSDIVSL